MKRLTSMFAILLFSAASPSFAGVFGDDLSRCLVDSTTKEDRATLVRWMFVAMAQHPMVASMSNVKAEEKDQANKEVAALFMRLMTDACGEKAKTAIKAEGPVTIEASFQVLGQVAARELFADPNVVAVMSGLEKHFDAEKLKAFLGADLAAH
jgi:hypothetical protein